jgi:hypothetical protein
MPFFPQYRIDILKMPSFWLSKGKYFSLNISLKQKNEKKFGN